MSPVYIKEIQTTDITKLFDIQSKSQNSFSVLHSALGYTQTEWLIEKKGDTGIKEFIIYDTKKDLAVIRIKPYDHVSQSTEIQMHCLQTKTNSTIIQFIQNLLKQLKNYDNITRFYCFLFPHETVEQDVLRQLNFEQEAVYDQHIFSKGKYLDLLAFGTQRT